MRRRQSFILLLAISAWALGFNQNQGWCGPSRRNLVVRHAKDEIAKRLGRVSTPRRRETVESEQEQSLQPVLSSVGMRCICLYNIPFEVSFLSLDLC